MMTVDELAESLDKERHRKLAIWRDAIDFAKEIYRMSAGFPDAERFGLTSQLRRAAVSVASNLAEGSKRLPVENKNFLRYALGSLAECDTQLVIAEALGYCGYSKSLKARIMSLTVGIRAYSKKLSPSPKP